MARSDHRRFAVSRKAWLAFASVRGSADRMRSLIISVGLLTVMVPALAADFSALDDRTLAGNSRYDRCLSLTQRNASLALGTAVAWQGNGGDGAATPCPALALIDLRRYPHAVA